MVFADYRDQKDEINAALESAKRWDLDYLPDNYRRYLSEGLSSMSGVFEAVEKIEQSVQSIEDYKPEYEPIHRQSRRIEADIRQINKDIEEIEQGVQRIRYSDEPDETAIAALEQNMVQVKQRQQSLKQEIPEAWEASRKRWEELNKQEKIARTQYRRLVDDSYQVIADIRAMAESSPALQQLKGNIEALYDAVRDEEIETAMAMIKQQESALSDVKNASPVKSPLSKARRALKRGQDRDKAAGLITQSLEKLDSEVSWREQAYQQLLPQFEQLDQVISQNIGLRSQARLSIDQAETIAGCLSYHKDISLAF
jgi:predicted  nucleic acid-binding Zn-ribbon protein